jgi:hypothetical protein
MSGGEEQRSDETIADRLHHFRWDLDKTYLKTDFETVSDLFRTFFQSAEEKRGVPGAATLLRELLRPSSDGVLRRVTFISGSPRQMRKVLREKLRIDGIEPDAFILKPNLSNLLLFRFRKLRGQVDYKLGALLESRIAGQHVQETLVGDDSESDAFVYSLYADLIEGRVDAERLERILRACNVYRRDLRRLLALYESLKPGIDVVNRIFIHLEMRSPTKRFDRYGARVVPIYNYFQAALLLFGDELLTAGSLLRVIESMGQQGYTPVTLANSLQDLMRRGFVSEDLMLRGLDVLARADAVLGRRGTHFLETFYEVMRGIESWARAPAPGPEVIDYLELCEHTRYKRKRPRLPGISWLRES